MVQIDIEVLVVGAIILMLVTWFVWYNVTGLIYKWRYKKKHGENDKGKKAEEKRRSGIGEFTGREPSITIREPADDNAGSTKFTERTILPSTTSISSGKDKPKRKGTVRKVRRIRRIRRRSS